MPILLEYTMVLVRIKSGVETFVLSRAEVLPSALCRLDKQVPRKSRLGRLQYQNLCFGKVGLQSRTLEKVSDSQGSIVRLPQNLTENRSAPP